MSAAGRIRYASERSPALWLWTVTLTIPGAPSGDASTINEAKSQFRAAWNGRTVRRSCRRFLRAWRVRTGPDGSGGEPRSPVCMERGC